MVNGPGARAGATVTLPGGLWVAGTRHQRATVGPLTGWDEEALLDSATAPAAHRTTALLARCVDELGDGPVDASTVRSLGVGDREALLWQVRRLTVGSALDAVVSCPDCGDKLDVALRVDDLLHDPYDEWPKQRTETLAGRAVTFRPPTGRDQERVAEQARTDPAAAGRALLAGCVVAIDGTDVDEGEGLDDALVEALSTRLAELDPQAEALLSVTCPTCDEAFTSPLDAAAFVFEEIARRSRYLHREVHVIASSYHWSEAEILGMTAPRRQRYLDLIDESWPGAGGS